MGGRAGFLAEVRKSARADPVRLVYRAHASPGRLRFRLSWLPDFATEADAIAEALAALAGVVEVRVRVFTGSVLVLYDPDFVDEARVTRTLLDAAGADHVTGYGHESAPDLAALLHGADQRGSAISRTLVDTVEGLHTDFLRLTGGRISLASASALVMLAAGFGRLTSRDDLELPHWHQLLWYAYQTFRGVQQRYEDGHRVHHPH
jgi:hypothetical protein